MSSSNTVSLTGVFPREGRFDFDVLDMVDANCFWSGAEDEDTPSAAAQNPFREPFELPPGMHIITPNRLRFDKTKNAKAKQKRRPGHANS